MKQLVISFFMLVFISVNINAAESYQQLSNSNNPEAVSVVVNDNINPEVANIGVPVKINFFQKIANKIRPQNILVGDDWMIALLLCAFLGGLGIHRFYLGYTGIGILQLLTGGGFGIWAFIDFFLILFRVLQPKGGAYKN